MLSKIAKQRLGKLIKVMESLPPEARKHFVMETYIRHEGDDEHSHVKPGQKVTRKHLTQCGTSACALGWAATIPAFNKAGLEMRWPWIYLDGQEYSWRRGIYAGGTFFDITADQAIELFNAQEVKTPKQWAKHAKAKLREWSAST